MTKEEIIAKWEKEIDNCQWHIDESCATSISRARADVEKRSISACLYDLKKLDVAIGSEEKKCPHCESELVNYNFTEGWSCDNCDESWRHF